MSISQSLFGMTVHPVELIIRAVAVYLFVVILIRLSGKRQLGQMSATEFVAVLLISNAVQNSMNGGDNSLVAGLILAVVLMLVSWSIAWVNFRSRKLSAVFEGTPRILVRHGQPITENLRRELISLNELRTMVRKQGILHLKNVKLAILESDGTLTVEHNIDEPEHTTTSGSKT